VEPTSKCLPNEAELNAAFLAQNAIETAVIQRCSDQLDVALDRLDHLVHLPAQYLLGKAKSVPLGRMEGSIRRQRQGVRIDNHIDNDGAALVRKGCSESRSDIAGLFDADALCTHRFGDFGKIRVLEFDAKWDQSGLLHLDLDEVEGFIVEDDLNHRRLGLIRTFADAADSFILF
jgi:hypothetical protein